MGSEGGEVGGIGVVEEVSGVGCGGLLGWASARWPLSAVWGYIFARLHRVPCIQEGVGADLGGCGKMWC